MYRNIFESRKYLGRFQRSELDDFSLTASHKMFVRNQYDACFQQNEIHNPQIILKSRFFWIRQLVQLAFSALRLCSR